ncbi:MAG: sigma-70 family RNA polymerase sigma factor [Saprospiraceae bacterium]
MADIQKIHGNTVIEALNRGEIQVLDQVYSYFKPQYIIWATKQFPGLNSQDILDSWHDTMIAFYEQVQSRKLTALQFELKTYLFTIGYRVLIKKHKIIKQISPEEHIDEQLLLQDLDYFSDENELLEEHKVILINSINDLPEQSKRILMLRFIEGKSLKHIAELVNYTSLNAISVSISRSLKRLKEDIQQKMELKSNGRK